MNWQRAEGFAYVNDYCTESFKLRRVNVDNAAKVLELVIHL